MLTSETVNQNGPNGWNTRGGQSERREGVQPLYPDIDVEFSLGQVARKRACLLGASGEVIGCWQVEPRAGEDASARARRLAEAFHEAAFSARVSLSQTELNSLDGSPLTGGRGAVDLGLPDLLRDPGSAPAAD